MNGHCPRALAAGFLVWVMVACGGDSTPVVESLTDDVRPSDPSAAEALEALGLADLPGLPTDEAARVQEERADGVWYQPDPHAEHYGHAHDDAAAQAALDALGPEERAILDEQLERARAAALRYPTFGDAHEAGYRAIGPAAPGIGVHAVQLRYQAQADFHFDYPGVLMYQDTLPDAPVVGILYMTRALDPPEGFVSSADHWHEHIKVCIRSAGEEIEVLSVDDGDFAKEACIEQGGVFFGESGWMLHVWPLDEWMPEAGVFADRNPRVVPRA